MCDRGQNIITKFIECYKRRRKCFICAHSSMRFDMQIFALFFIILSLLLLGSKSDKHNHHKNPHSEVKYRVAFCIGPLSSNYRSQLEAYLSDCKNLALRLIAGCWTNPNKIFSSLLNEFLEKISLRDGFRFVLFKKQWLKFKNCYNI